MNRNYDALKALGADGTDKITDRRAVVLLGEASGYKEDRLRFYVDATAPTVEAAISGITQDGVNPLPSYLVDLDADPCELVRLRYDLIDGLSQEPIARLGDPDIVDVVISCRDEDW